MANGQAHRRAQSTDTDRSSADSTLKHATLTAPRHRHNTRTAFRESAHRTLVTHFGFRFTISAMHVCVTYIHTAVKPPRFADAANVNLVPHSASPCMSCFIFRLL